MHWFPFYSSDFIGATLDCSCLERSMYAWMLILYYERREPFPKDKHRLTRLIGADSFEEKSVIASILNRFFIEREDGWYQPQAEEIIARQNATHQRLVEAGTRGGQASVQARLKPGFKPRSSPAQAKENQNQIYIQNQNQNQEPKPSPPLPSWLPLEAWSQYQEHRRAKRARLTPRAVVLCFNKLEKLKSQGQDPVAVIEQSIAMGWTGLFPVAADKSHTDTAWWTSEQETERIARSIGMWPARPGESWNEFRQRIRVKLQENQHAS